MLENLGLRVGNGDPVTSVKREAGKVSIGLPSGVQLSFDQVVLACHADEALALLAGPLPVEEEILSRFEYHQRALLHSDERHMPRSRRVWSSRNYLASQQGEGHALNDERLLAALIQFPLMTLKVMAAIHWQALKIWLRGAPFFPKPPPPVEKLTQSC
jgi:predicted NAD/FAD-binding protein